MGLGNDEEEDNNNNNNNNKNNNDKVVDDGDAGGGKSFGSVSCSICLEVVADNGDRSWSKLQCSHQFHLGNFNFSPYLTHNACKLYN